MGRMQCRDARGLVSALIDGEAAGENERAVAAHVAACPACTALANDYRRIGRQLATGHEPAPANLADKIRARLAAEPVEAVRGSAWRPDWHRWARQAAVLLLAAGLSALLTWHLTLSSARDASLEREVVAAHVRSLLQERTIQIASSDSHAVKPWFAGRVDFAPAVKDLTAQGFALTGGRLDLVGDRRVAALVYKLRQHVIDVFMWPASGLESAGPKLAAFRGYNTLTWTAGGLTYWAVSDLNAAELGELAKLL
jgi:anti-sigma factor RsiW